MKPIKSGEAASFNSQHWSEFWRHGSLTTFLDGQFQKGYDGPVAEFWEQTFGGLPPKATIVDLATGNGAIPYIASLVGRRRRANWRIIGVDYAAIRLPDDPTVRAHMESVELLPHTPMENTGLVAGCADMVTSHFGIEYGNRRRVVTEVGRVLSGRGKLVLVLHHLNSAVVQQAKRDYKQTLLCLEEEQLDRKVSRLVRLVGHARTPEQRASLRNNPEAERLRHEINQTMERLLQKVSGQEDDSQMFRVAQSFLRVFADLIDRPLEEKLNFIRESSRSLSAYAGRMESMARATMSDEVVDEFTHQLRGVGLEPVSSGTLTTEDGELLARTLVAERDAAG